MAGLATAQRYTLRIVGKVVVLRVLNLGSVERWSVAGRVEFRNRTFDASQKATKRQPPKGDAGS